MDIDTDVTSSESSVALPVCYKRTDVGAIPQDWESACLGDVADIRMCKRIFAEQTSPTGDIPFFKIGTFGGIPDAFIPFALYDEYRRKYSFPLKGDILLSAAGTLGKTVVYDGQDAYFQDSNIVWLDVDQQKIANEFLHQCYQQIEWASPEGSTISRLYNGIIRATQIPLPPSLEEQRAIAAALSDVDELIGALDKLIAKKRAIKLATMQQLLTGKTRLPGYSGEWVERQLGDIASLYQPVTISARQFTSGGYPVYGANGVVGFYTDFNHDNWQVTVTCRGSTCGTVNRTVNRCWITGNAMVVNCNHNSEVDKVFLYYLLLSRDLSACITGTGQPQIVRGPLARFELSLPVQITEQVAIATVLSDMDAEITALEQRRDKTKAIKQGMMQQLLTGRIRLVKPEGTA